LTGEGQWVGEAGLYTNDQSKNGKQVVARIKGRQTIYLPMVFINIVMWLHSHMTASLTCFSMSPWLTRRELICCCAMSRCVTAWLNCSAGNTQTRKF